MMRLEKLYMQDYHSKHGQNGNEHRTSSIPVQRILELIRLRFPEDEISPYLPGDPAARWDWLTIVIPRNRQNTAIHLQHIR
jgi:hypothetical protein